MHTITTPKIATPTIATDTINSPTIGLFARLKVRWAEFWTWIKGKSSKQFTNEIIVCPHFRDIGDGEDFCVGTA